ncbi:MAG: PD-(D/E)XK nuclease family protein [Candidatus Omnitrophota bacterium]|jgi:DNA helicase-2/ATP-dependent DNA helicase PcrA|nr:MAG: PD-(D/E)XK nuclease family protein [Candidatus Omnitrophota bacterium]
MNDILEGLNKEQKEAVTSKEGPLLIIAGAGTGKTTVITRRIAWLISQGLASTDQVLALTFTDKAAAQMQERVDMLVPYGYTDIWISTFHAFGDRILRENPIQSGLSPDFKVLNQAEASVFLREHLFEFDLSYYRPLAEPTRFIQALISFFSRAKDEDISASELLKYAGSLSEKAAGSNDEILKEEAAHQVEVAHAYMKYQELLLKEGVVDFASQFYMALELLRAHPMVLNGYQNKFKYILVDEFQDTNFSQFQMIKLLAGKSRNVAVVADDDQCIYRWRGAAYSNVLNFMNEYPDAEKITLIQNYRSTKPILDTAYRLIQNNNPDRFEIKANINKRLISLKGEGEAVRYLHFDTNSDEADKVAAVIKEECSKGGFKYRDFAILVRSNSDSQAFLQALNMQDIPWQFSGSHGLYSRPEVMMCISFLRASADIYDSLNLYYLLTSEVYKVDMKDLSYFSHYARRRNKPLYFVLKDAGQIPEFNDVNQATKDKVLRFLSDFEHFVEASREETTGRLLYLFLTDTGYLKSLTSDMTPEKESKIQNIAKFFNIVRNFELIARHDRVGSFVKHLNLLIEAGDDPSTVDIDFYDINAVNVLTIHKAKGLEFGVVFLVDLAQGKFPLPRRKQPIELDDHLIKEVLPTGDFHIQEERRLFYVGMTRAKDKLYLTSADDYGGKRARKVSQFVIESVGEVAPEALKEKSSALELIQRFAPVRNKVKPVVNEQSAARVINLSYYHIDDYLTCPLKYKYVNILRVPIMEHHTVIYGRAMHEAVTGYFQAVMSGRGMDKDELLNIFENSFDPQGFLDLKHQLERKRLGKEALLRFYDQQAKQPCKAKFIEKEFSFVQGQNRITGRFDRIDEEDGGAVVIDFKTSDIKTQKEADKRVKESMQLKLYSLAYREIFGELPLRVELHFLESGLIGRKEIDEADIKDVEENIDSVAEGIRNNKFEATPNYMSCTYCAYNEICPFSMAK